jgi:replicative DNA helicase
VVVTSTPTPLSSGRALPPFPIDSLPAVFATEVAAVATFTQTDPGMAGVTALTVIAACAGGRCEIEVRPGWREPLNIFTATIAEPGERKSAVHSVLTAPLLEAERELVEESKERILEAETTRDIAFKVAERAKAAAGNAENAERQSSAATAISAALQAEAVVVPTMPRIVADDVTPEAAGSLMAEQHGRLAIISAEGGIFDILAGRYSGNVNLDTFLKGHSGDTLKVDRKGRAPEYIPRPALTVGVMIQPVVLTHIAKNGAMRGRGLLARFLYSQPPSKVGHRLVDAPIVPEAAQDAYDTAVKGLAVTLAGWEDPAVLKVSDDALEVLMDFARSIEPQLQGGARLGHVRDWASKLVGATARIAGLLHLGGDPEDGWRQEVGIDPVVKAITIADYFTEHALEAFDAMQADPVTADAQYLLEVIRREEWEVVSKRDMFSKASRSRFPKVSDLDVVITKLEEHGYLEQIAPPERSGRGRPPSPTWSVHPHLLAAQTAVIAESQEVAQ